MAHQHLPADEPFFREWQGRRPGERRSLARARLVAEALGLQGLPTPVLTVVGSKGKGTTALYAAATLAAGRLKVGLLTSPGVLDNRERIRVDGRAIPPEAYDALSRRLESALTRVGTAARETGYLSPTGLFTLMGVRHMLDAGCDVLVLEAGMGGRADEVSLFPPRVVAISAIFAEHLGILGSSVEEIARNKAGVAAESTSLALTVPQAPEVRSAIEDELARIGVRLLTVSPGGAGVRPGGLPAGLSRANARLGIAAARQLLATEELPPPGTEACERVFSSVRTPGRLSVHGDPRGRTWVVDAAISAPGVRAALRWTEQHIGGPDSILVSLPVGKDLAGARRELSGRDYIAVSVAAEHIEFRAEDWEGIVPFEELPEERLGERVLAVGTWSFVAAVLRRLGVDLERVYSPLAD